MDAGEDIVSRGDDPGTGEGLADMVADVANTAHDKNNGRHEPPLSKVSK